MQYPQTGRYHNLWQSGGYQDTEFRIIEWRTIDYSNPSIYIVKYIVPSNLNLRGHSIYVECKSRDCCKFI